MTDTATDQPVTEQTLPRDRPSVLRNEQGELIVHVPPEMIIARQQEQIAALSTQNVSLSLAVEAYRSELATAIARIDEMGEEHNQMGHALQAMTMQQGPPQPCADCPPPPEGITTEALSRMGNGNGLDGFSVIDVPDHGPGLDPHQH